MDRCEECIHYNVCDRSSMLLWHTMKGIERCLHFVDKDNVVEVVRCKDCKQGVYPRGHKYCMQHKMIVQGMHYCALGERRNDNAE